jgi:hypothetical protein
MRHFVHGPDGQKYGPADFETLVQWRDEGRVSLSTLLEEETGGVPFEAERLPGLFAPLTDDRTIYTGYPRPAMIPADPRRLAVWGWILATLSIFVCPFGLGAAAIVLAYRARELGYSRGNLLLGYAVACMGVGLILGVVVLTSSGVTKG